MGALLRALREYGIKGTWRKLYKMRMIKFGRLVGVDKYGNHYYENTVDYPLNQHRWVEYAGDKSAYEADASNVPPEWHGWLHSSTSEPPTDVRSHDAAQPCQHGSLETAARISHAGCSRTSNTEFFSMVRNLFCFVALCRRPSEAPTVSLLRPTHMAPLRRTSAAWAVSSLLLLPTSLSSGRAGMASEMG